MVGNVLGSRPFRLELRRVLVLFASVPLSVALSRSHDAVARRPNVLIIVMDDQRGGLEVMPKTRRWFLSRGTRFPNAYVTTPTCCPSRASILTGRYAHNHGIRSNFGTNRFNHRATIYGYLKRAGYRTALFGKFFEPWNLFRDPPIFDEFAITHGGTYYNGRWNMNSTVRTVSTYSTTVIRRRARDFLIDSERRDRTPWLLYVAPTAPHTPFTPEPRYEKARVRGWHGNPAVRESNESDKPRYVRLRDRQVKPGRKHRRQQFRTLMSVDDLIDQIARTLHYLKEHRRTLAVFTSDNGLLWSEHGLLGKDVPYTQAVHVPLLIRWPGHVRRSIDRRLVANIDIAPTVLRAAGLPLPVEPPLDGRNLLRQGWRRRHLLLEHWCNRRGNCKRWAAALGKGYEYVEYSPRGETGFREFYKLRRDPWQLTNLLNDGVRANNPNTHRLHRRLQHARLCSGASCP